MRAKKAAMSFGRFLGRKAPRATAAMGKAAARVKSAVMAVLQRMTRFSKARKADPKKAAAVLKMNAIGQAASLAQRVLSEVANEIIDATVEDEAMRTKLKIVAAIIIGILIGILSGKAAAKSANKLAGSSALAALQVAQSGIGLANDISGSVFAFRQGELSQREAERNFTIAILNVINEIFTDDKKKQEKQAKNFRDILKKVRAALQKAFEARAQALNMAGQSAA